MQYRKIARAERVEEVLFYFSDLEPDVKWYGKTKGCDCCSHVEPLTAEDLRQYVADLEEALSEARTALSELE